ncbi:TPA: DEAD/DEAH box helicase [Methanosarcinaceae archaeon]|nr:DEAD/DEAH box helicase [Methanosarcinaceae archaeon]
MDIKPGDIVDLRHRLWRVDYVDGESKVFQATNIDGGRPRRQKFYYPLESVSEASIPEPSLEKIGDSATNKLLIQSFRYSILHGSAPLLSLQRSSVIPPHYQLVPVVMALNKSERVRMLIADDVGLGKTVEAGLIATELMARNLVSRILVICPKNLCEQWRDALHSFFQIDARVISSVHRRVLERNLPPGASPWKHYPFLIASIDYTKKDPTKYQVLEVPWDLVIVDEAHLAAKPHQITEKQSVSMERYNFVKELTAQKQVKNLLFLTATPHNGYTDTYASLLNMLDCGIVSGPINEPRINRDIAKHHVCQRRRKDVEDWFKEHSEEENPFPERNQEEVTIDLVHEEEKEIIEKLERYGKGILNLAEGGSHKVRMTAQWVVMHLQKRALSSPDALRISLKNRLERVVEKIEKEETSDDINISVAQAKASALDEELVDDLSDEEVSTRMDQTSFGSLEALKAEKAELEELIKLASRITSAKDSKLKRLTNPKNGILKNSVSGVYGTKKAIIFTRYKDTLDYLEKEIPKQLRKTISQEQVVTVDGDLTDALRNERLAEFQKLDQGILIATDCISEGINLQHMANQVIHYELPWNPNRLEQRNGRVDRYGQKARKVYVRTLVMNDTLDATILKVLVRKAKQIREDYGFAPPFFGDDSNVFDMIQDIGVEKLPSSQSSLFEFDGGARKDGEKVPDHEKVNPFDNEVLENIKAESFYGQTDVDLSEIRRRLKETEESIGTQEEFTTFVLNGLRSFGCTVTENMDLQNSLKIELSSRFKVGGYGETIEKATFDPKVAIENIDIEHLNVGHPVIRRLFELVKNSVFDPRREEYGRTSVVSTPEVEKVTAMYFFLVRFTVGTESVSIIEEIIPVACNLIDRKALSQDEIYKLIRASPAPSRRPKEDYLRHLELAMKPEMYEAAFEDTVNMHVERIGQERGALKEKLMQDSENHEWLEGIDRIERASSDLVAVRLLEPVPKTGVRE